MRWTVSILFVTLALAAAPASVAARARASARVPQGFVGVDGAMTDNADPASQFDAMVANGVESIRVAFNWNVMQPYASFARVPAAQRSSFANVGGIPTSFADSDQTVGLAAQRGLSVGLAIVISAPAWDAIPRPCSPPPARDVHMAEQIVAAPIRATSAQCYNYVSVPARDGPYGNFLKALVGRYGPHGSFWRQNPGIARRPIRNWVIWNEPNFLYNWGPQPFERSYVALLRAAHAAIKSADPGAKVVLSGFANFAWDTLAQVYKIRGARGFFDVVDIHPYTKQVQGVFTILKKIRETMARYGDARKPIVVGEWTWASAIGKAPSSTDFGIETTEAGQAQRVSAALPLFAAQRQRLGLTAIYYYDWVSAEYSGAPSFGYSGLLADRGGRVVVKPALAAFGAAALKLEHCRQKGSIATRCLRSSG